jgi:phosphopantothenoylcysteine synthetase/decarboxylase
MEKAIEFFIDGVKAGSSTLFIENGEIDTSLAEQSFWKAVRYSRQQLIDDERDYIVDSLTSEHEEKLKAAHAEDYHGTDDDMPDTYENWMNDLSLEEIKKIIA